MLVLERDYRENCTLGELYMNGSFFAYTLEEPYKNNQRNISCIPEGEYHLIEYLSAKFGKNTHGIVPLVVDTAPREYILMHPGNTVLDTRGCILIGSKIGELTIEGAKYDAVLNSVEAFKDLVYYLVEEWKCRDEIPFKIVGL